ncbi:Rox3-domain-containing protein [Lentithecium fluviatile CBS 122367]|uniref:Mediator of RNA polymerase II transcription subunit 19 n=1 Tax=Lentithecium fluviatile CBS 122367 TaxID=1168545 RepID=A0A6G1JM82_9PLEO|nr:Rox3-domain-containing protein [Lentithecium fluviatile CBS 122367]
MNIDSDGDAMMDDSQDEEAARLGGHRRSDHNRQRNAIFAPEGGVAAAKGVYGSQLFKPCQSTHTVSRPHGSQNLFELYGLNSLARSVARNDPITGEKINKLRKSYEGHIKSLQIAGKPKAIKMEGKLAGPLQIPDEEYQLLMVQGKEIHRALNTQETRLTPDFDSLLNSALGGMSPGSLPAPDTTKYRAYLGTDEPVKAKAGPEVAPHRIIPSAAATPNPHTPAGGPRASRPERAGSKRQYTDHSFQGYGEGFVDDYAESTGGEDNAQGSMAKKRRLAFERTSHQVEVGGVRR